MKYSTSSISYRAAAIPVVVGYCSYLRATYFFQKLTDSVYLAKSRGTPLPPCSLPRALRMTVMGCIGSS